MRHHQQPTKRHFFTSSLALAILLSSALLPGCASDDPGDTGRSNPNQGGDVGSDTSGGGWDSSPSYDTSTDSYSGYDSGGVSDASSDSNSGFDTSADARPDVASDAGVEPEPDTGNTNVSFGGDQDFGYFRSQLDDGVVPVVDTFSSSGFFAEHHTPLPAPDCGERICLQTMLGVLGNLINGNDCTMLQLGLNSPILPDPNNRPPLTLAVVVDTSGSMSGDPIRHVQAGLGEMLDAMQDDDHLALIRYSDDDEVLVEMGPVGGNRGRYRDAISGLAASGGTNIFDGLQRGYSEVLASYDSGRQNRVILLSDGNVNNTGEILTMSAAYNSDGVGITTVGLGNSFNFELMSGLADQGDGNFYFVEDEAAVTEVFREEISFFTVPVAFDLTLEFTEGSAYRFMAAHGTNNWETTDDGGRLEIPSVFLAHRESHDDVTPDGGRRGGGSALMIELMPRQTFPGIADMTEADVAEVLVTYREPGTDRIVEQTSITNYPHSPLFFADTGYFESSDLSIVHKSFVMLNIFAGFELASTSFYAGGGTEAVQLMERLLAAVVDYNEEIEDVDIIYDIELMEQFIDVLIANGATQPVEPEIPSDPWPCD